MTDAQLETVIARTRHERLRWLTSDANPDAVRRDGYREMVARLAEGSPPPPPEPAYPPLATQAANLAGAAGRFLASGLATVSKREYRRRRAICEACPLYDAAADRCTACACYLSVKPWMKSEHCPERKW